MSSKRHKVLKDLTEEGFKGTANPDKFIQAILDKEKVVIPKPTKPNDPLLDDVQESFSVGILRSFVPEKAPDIAKG